MIIVKNQTAKTFDELNDVIKDLGNQALSKETIEGVETISGTINTGDTATDTTLTSLVNSFNRLVENIRNQ
jgi:hypothetical protein